MCQEFLFLYIYNKCSACWLLYLCVSPFLKSGKLSYLKMKSKIKIGWNLMMLTFWVVDIEHFRWMNEWKWKIFFRIETHVNLTQFSFNILSVRPDQKYFFLTNTQNINALEQKIVVESFNMENIAQEFIEHRFKRLYDNYFLFCFVFE